MWQRRVLVFGGIIAGTLSLWGCSQSPNFIARHEPWREREERACLASGYVREHAYLTTRTALGGPSVCGAIRPFKMSGTADGQIGLKPPALLRCPMIPAVERWVETILKPATRYYYGTQVAEIKVAASYGCRPINHVNGARLSEHGHANALDISAVTLVDGRTIKVKDGWHGDRREREFLRSLHKGACRMFTTVLGPNYDRHHRDHFHFDLARRRNGGVCK